MFHSLSRARPEIQKQLHIIVNLKFHVASTCFTNTPKLNEYTDATQIEEPDIAAGSRDLCPHEGLGDRMQSE